MAEATTEAEQVVREYVRVINEREFSTLPDIMAESFTFTSPTDGTIRGRENVEAHLRELVEGFSDIHFTVHKVLADDQIVMTETTISGTHDGEFNGIPPTNQEVELPEMATFVVEEGKLHEERTYYDQQNLLSQLGIIDE